MILVRTGILRAIIGNMPQMLTTMQIGRSMKPTFLRSHSMVTTVTWGVHDL